MRFNGYSFLPFLFLSAITLLLPVKSYAQSYDSNLDKLNDAQKISYLLASNIEIPDIVYVPLPPPKYWTNGMLNQIGFSQLGLLNWAEGGNGSVSFNTYLNAHANYKKGDMFWDNRLEAAYGFMYDNNETYKKGDDKLNFESKWGYRAVNKFFFSALFTAKTQLTPTYNASDKSVIKSALLSPGYFSLGLGVDYQPYSFLSINFAPLTGNLVVVLREELRANYGNVNGEKVRKELGAQLKTDFKKNLTKDFNLTTSLTLFSDFLDKPENIKIKWDVTATFIINKYFTTTLRTNLVYDDKVRLADKDGNEVPKVQLKEVFSLNFSYVFGNYQKKK